MATPADTCAHQVLLYESIEELLVCAVPFLRDGLDDGDTVVLAVNPHEELPILNALGDASRVRLIGNQTYTSADTAVEVMTAFLDELLAGGAAQIRIAGALPPGYAGDWEQWQHYERAMSAALEQLPVSAMCLYDRRAMTAEMAEQASDLHPILARPFGLHAPNPTYAG